MRKRRRASSRSASRRLDRRLLRAPPPLRLAHGLRLPVGVLPAEPPRDGVVVGSPRPSASSLRPISSPSACLRGKSAGDSGGVAHIERHEVEIFVGEDLQARGRRHGLPFAAQGRDRDFLGVDLPHELRRLLGVVERVVFDAVGVERRADQAADGRDVEKPDHLRLRARRGLPAGEQGLGRSLRGKGECAAHAPAELGRTGARIAGELRRAGRDRPADRREGARGGALASADAATRAARARCCLAGSA